MKCCGVTLQCITSTGEQSYFVSSRFMLQGNWDKLRLNGSVGSSTDFTSTTLNQKNAFSVVVRVC